MQVLTWRKLVFFDCKSPLEEIIHDYLILVLELSGLEKHINVWEEPTMQFSFLDQSSSFNITILIARALLLNDYLRSII